MTKKRFSFFPTSLPSSLTYSITQSWLSLSHLGNALDAPFPGFVGVEQIKYLSFDAEIFLKGKEVVFPRTAAGLNQRHFSRRVDGEPVGDGRCHDTPSRPPRIPGEINNVYYT